MKQMYTPSDAHTEGSIPQEGTTPSTKDKAYLFTDDLSLAGVWTSSSPGSRQEPGCQEVRVAAYTPAITFDTCGNDTFFVSKVEQDHNFGPLGQDVHEASASGQFAKILTPPQHPAVAVRGSMTVDDCVLHLRETLTEKDLNDWAIRKKRSQGVPASDGTTDDLSDNVVGETRVFVTVATFCPRDQNDLKNPDPKFGILDVEEKDEEGWQGD